MFDCTRPSRRGRALVRAGQNIQVYLNGTLELSVVDGTYESGRRGDFVVFDLASALPSLIESEPFGHVRGAFTGAASDRRACSRRPPAARCFSTRSASSTARCSRACCAPSSRARCAPSAASPIATPSFACACRRCERKEDLPLIIGDFLRAQARPIQLPPEAWAILAEYDWPGNVRELRNALERALSLLPADVTTLTPELLGISTVGAAAGLPWPKVGEADFVRQRDALLRAWERNYLVQLLERSGHNVARAAREGGMHRIYLHRLIRKHGIALNPHRRGTRPRHD